MSEPASEHADMLRALLHGDDARKLVEFLDPLHPADLADMLGDLERDDQVRLLKHLGTDKAADVLAVVDEHSGTALLELLSDHEVVSLLGEMPSDDAADLIAGLPPEKSEQINALLPAGEREVLHELMEFEEDSAGGIMEVEKVAVREGATIRDAIDLVRRLADDIENLQDVYIVGAGGRLVGAIPILDLLLHEQNERVVDVMDDSVISVPVDMDQEQVAAMFGKYDEFILPVVDGEGRLVGRITVDDIIDVLEEEASEDIASIVGTQEEIGERSTLRISRARLPWLFIAMIGQILNAFIMSRYVLSIEALITLAFFVPLVIGTAGGAGIQAAVVVVREVALGQSAAAKIGRRVFRELRVTILNGAALGAALFAIVTLWTRDRGLGLLLWVTLLSATSLSALMGASIPLVLHRLRVDPAVASGPFITVLSDIIGLTIYMTFATVYLGVIRG